MRYGAGIAMAAWAAFAAPLSAVAQPPPQNHASYEKAVVETGMGPGYVLVTIVDAQTGASRTGCTDVHSMISAMMKEFDLPANDQGVAGAKAKLLSPSHSFRLSKPAALAAVTLSTAEDAEVVRREMGLTSREAVLNKASPNPGVGMALNVGGKDRHVRQRALACVLIEYGFTPRRAAEAINIIYF